MEPQIKTLPYKMNSLPLNASGFFSAQAEADLNLAENISRRKRDFSQLMRDLGIRNSANGLTPDWNNRFGAFAEGYRGAAANTAGRGFGASRSMRRMTFAPVRSDITKQANRSRGDMLADNALDKNRRRQILGALAREAAQYGYQSRQPGEKR